MSRKIAVIGIVLKGDRSVSKDIQLILSEYGDNMLGRMGIPSRCSDVSVISVVMEGTSEEISAITGKLGRLNNVNVKSAVTSVSIDS